MSVRWTWLWARCLASAVHRYSRLDGSVSAFGIAAAAAYDVVEFGKFAGAISLNGGALSDADRWYPFGTLGFTVGPAGQEDE